MSRVWPGSKSRSRNDQAKKGCSPDPHTVGVLPGQGWEEKMSAGVKQKAGFGRSRTAADSGEFRDSAILQVR